MNVAGATGTWSFKIFNCVSERVLFGDCGGGRLGLSNIHRLIYNHDPSLALPIANGFVCDGMLHLGVAIGVGLRVKLHIKGVPGWRGLGSPLQELLCGCRSRRVR